MTALVERLVPAPRSARFGALVVAVEPQLREEVARRLHRLGAVDVALARTVDEAREVAAAVGPREIAVVEPALEDGSGLALLTELRAAGWGAGLVLSTHQSPFAVRAALSAGARAFLVTGEGGPRIATVEGRPTRVGGTDSLSLREVQVLQLVADGQSNKDVGDRLGLSALTVKSHMARIARKLGTGDRAEMVAVALRARVIT